ncbi:acyl-CoA synthetase short-chain family member 3, mitochondrial [Podospora fimiseda]|uniref:Acyl-CoA synthetase short-chain family member 3, mitochondrial n=1 Tax=Podospora fimiseda TaxID=252190 RepID=A0AAN7BVQ1_9PEZI|nr:acyl-CoA synthetase short-chain family member 3, mitochondrial [Podospora fimiseda]
MASQDKLQSQSLNDPETFWSHQAQRLHWHKPPSSALKKTTKTLPNGITHDHWEWFPNGQISTCFNCVDRHVLSGKGNSPAIHYDSPVTKTKQTITYKQLLNEVEIFAAVLRQEGVKKGDVVLVYMPMIPAALIGILAINRLGAIHAVVFGGFAAGALAQRIEACKPVAILTASCGIDGNKPPDSYRDYIEEAICLSSWKPPRTIIYQREELPWRPIIRPDGERNWQHLVKSARNRGFRAGCVPVGSTDPIYIIYTSGTTGKPKGVVREAGGHAVGLSLSISYLFGINGPGDVMGCFSDIGWVVSHSYTLYGPLLVGAATVLYEGKPVGTPDASAFWRMTEEYRINTMFTAPTALRAIRKADPDNLALMGIRDRGGMDSLRALFLAGERSEPSIIKLYSDLLGSTTVGTKIVDNWWSSESGSPITGISPFLSPPAGGLPIRPGSAGKPMPGFSVSVVSDSGEILPANKMGNIVLGLPLAPTAFRSLWQDDERFYHSYLGRFEGKYIDTGDAGIIDEDGYVHIMARTDDIINVAAHRLSTGALEQAVASHPLVTECCVVSVPDALKGHLPFAFVGTAEKVEDEERLLGEVQKLVRTQVGPIATLGGMIVGSGMIPKTRSGKMLRRVLRELLENAVHGELEKKVEVPSTVEDAGVVEVTREKVRGYFERNGGRHGVIEVGLKAKL